jgi:hypothetical protein
MRKLWVAAVLAAAAGLVPAAPAAARRSPPKILQGSLTANVFMVRPPEMVFWSPIVKIFTAYVTGPNVTRYDWNHRRTGHIAWIRWNRREAVGIGKWWEDSCAPDCARGPFEPEHAVIRAWRVRAGRYTRMSATLSAPGLRPLTFTYKLLLSVKRYGGYRIYYWGTRTTIAF